MIAIVQGLQNILFCIKSFTFFSLLSASNENPMYHSNVHYFQGNLFHNKELISCWVWDLQNHWIISCLRFIAADSIQTHQVCVWPKSAKIRQTLQNSPTASLFKSHQNPPTASLAKIRQNLPNAPACHALHVRGASKIKLEKVNKKRTVTVRRVIIFLNISRRPLLICL